MRYTLVIVLSLTAALMMFGCGSDNPTQPSTPKAQRIVVAAAASAPAMTSVNGAAWDAITATAVDLSTTLAPAPAQGGVTAISDSAYVKALTFHDTLYLRLTWNDASHSVWRGAYAVLDTVDHQGTPVTSFNLPDSVGRQEDQLWILFSGLVGGDWDGTNWRALTTDSAFLAEGINLHRATASDPWSLVTDAGTMEVTTRNIGLFQGLPIYFHKDTSAYHGYTLFSGDNLRAADNLIRGWDIGQEVPSYILDSTKWHQSAATRGSRWDTRTISTYTGGQYTVVLSRPMNTGYTDDVTLTDSVKTKIGVFDNQMDINVGGTGRGFSKEFWLVF